jgi:hypothetical protein
VRWLDGHEQNRRNDGEAGVLGFLMDVHGVTCSTGDGMLPGQDATCISGNLVC